MPTADDFREGLYRMLREAVRDGQPTAEITAGELHRYVGGYPGRDHRMPLCCDVMRAAMDVAAGDVIVEQPPAGDGANLTIIYVLPRQEQERAPIPGRTYRQAPC